MGVSVQNTPLIRILFCFAVHPNPSHLHIFFDAVGKISVTPSAKFRGPKSNLNGSLRALEIKMNHEVLNRLDEIFPGPGGPAPEAYTWG
jgi:hypothetical protein